MKLIKSLNPTIGTALAIATMMLASQPQIATSQASGSKIEPSPHNQIFSNIFPIKLNGKWGYIDRTGKIVVRPQFDRTFDFRNGLAPFQIGRKLGFIDRTGKVVVQPQFDLAFICKSLTDHSLIKPQISEDADSKNVIQAGLVSMQFSGCYKDLILVVNGNKTEYLDRTGKIISEPQSNQKNTDLEDLIPVNIGRKYGYKDRTGKIVIQPKFDMALYFHENLAQVIIFDERNAKIQCGYIDQAGKYAIEPRQCDDLGGANFSEGLVRIKVKDKWGYIDRNGKTVIKPQFDEAFDFYDGLAMVIVGSKRGYINRTGQYIWKPTS